MNKQILVFIALLLSSSIVVAQNTRLVSVHSANYVPASMSYEPFDSVKIIYAANNKQAGGNVAYINKDLKYDTSQRVRFQIANGYYKNDNIVYEYDANWNVIQKTTQRPSPTITSPMVYTYRELYEYDSKGNQTKWLTLVWDKQTSKWDSSRRYIFNYDANNNMVSSMLENYKNGVFEKQWRYTNTYDPNNNIISHLTENWSTSIPGFDTANLKTTHYDMSGNIDTLLWQSFDINTRQWNNQGRAYYVYTGGVQTLHISESWSGSFWRLSNKDETFYNAQKKMTYNDYSAWNVSTSMWEYLERDSIAMLSNSPRVEYRINRRWNTNKNDFVNYQRIKRSYNFDDYLTQSVQNTWDTTQKSWVRSLATDSTQYTYEAVPGLSVNNINSTVAFNLYPNPSRGGVMHIALTGATSAHTVAIYSLQGQLLYQSQFADGSMYKAIPTTFLNNGQYVITVKTPTSKSSKLFVVLK